MLRLFLVRHGETVDNVASLYAGTRDSALTSHGILQCRRLAEHLAPKLRPAPSSPSSTPPVRTDEQSHGAGLDASPRVHLFSSNLQRAVKTAEAVRDALSRDPQVAVPVRQLAELKEKDFGSGEGQSFAAGARRDKPHVGAETSVAMRARVDVFLETHLLPVLERAVSSDDDDGNTAVVIVAHGIILGVLFRRLCERVAGRLTFDPEVKTDGREVTPSWSNTGYLEAVLSFTSSSPTDPCDWAQVSMSVSRVNATEHLKGLRKTRGGIGSARFDDKQKTIESFFTKKRKFADAAE